MNASPQPLKEPLFNEQWKPKSLLAFHCIAFALLGSWLLPEGHAIWRSIDESLFFFLNGTLEEGENWQFFWALMNVRITDLTPLVIIMVTLTFPILGIARQQSHQAFIGFIWLLILMFLIRRTLYDFSVSEGLSSTSPSLQLQPAFMLSELFPELGTKDRATQSFPGDHAAVLWVWCGYLWLTLRSWKAAALTPIAIMFMLPRLVAGAHWFTDNFVGGLFVAFIALSWALHTPLLRKLEKYSNRYFSPLIYRIGASVPILQKLPFFKP